MTEWKTARILRTAMDKGQQFTFFTVEGESKEFRQTPKALMAAIGSALEDGTEFEVTLKKGDKGSFKVDRYQKSTRQPSATKNGTHQPASLTAARIPSNNPYTFLPIDLAGSVKDAPVWHDGSSEATTYSGELHCTLTALTPLLVGNQRFEIQHARPEQLPDPADLDPHKAILEPLRLTDGRVLLPGSSLKGMLRNNLASLLNAPMDRVKDHHYTYRPNLDFTNKEKKYDVRPAIVTQINPQSIMVNVLPTARSAVFRENQKPPNAQTFTYRGGIDGSGIFARAQAEANNKRGDTYTRAYVSSQDIKQVKAMEISKPVFEAYEKTQKILANDQSGHLTAHPLKEHFHGNVAQAIEDATALKVNQLIYVEVEQDGQGKITSLGHHFRYRWAYRDSIRYRNALQPAQQQLRDELVDTAPQEQNGELTAARLLFGFVANSSANEADTLDKLAGRIAINHAISAAAPQFINPEQQHWVFLNTLGQPKASAVEHYLKQPKQGLMQTYGDLPDQAGSELAGRKVYPHQPAAASDPGCYETTNNETRNSKQATLARYVSAPGTTFRFSLRFARLRDWELGALIAALNPHRLKNDQAKFADYALKLGYGRPLGLGSVNIAIDAVILNGQRNNDPETLFKPWLEAARERLSEKTLKEWLEVLRFKGDKRAYPTATNKGETTIFNHHSNIRRDHSKARRET